MDQEKRDPRKSIHDLESAIFTLKQAVAEVKGGYRFDDHFALAKIDSLSKASVIIIEAAQQVVAQMRTNIKK